jgi:DNA replication protein DnaC
MERPVLVCVVLSWPARRDRLAGARLTNGCIASTPSSAGRLDAELDKLRGAPLVVCDEVGYIPFEPKAAALSYALVASRYERASMIVSSNKPFSVWTEIFGDAVAVPP